MEATEGYVVEPGQAEKRWMGETFTYFLATGDRTGGRFALVDEQARRGESVPLHKHDADDESFYVVEGEVSFFVGGMHPRRGVPGTFVHVPGGTVHGFRVESENARYLILTTPRHGEFYRAITLASRQGGLRPDGKIDGEVIGKACREYGIDYVGPLPK